MQKHFNLVNFNQQNNHFVVFDEFFNCIANNLTYDNTTNRAIRAIPNNDNNINIQIIIIVNNVIIIKWNSKF